MEVSRPSDPIHDRIARSELKTSTLEINLGQPFPATAIFVMVVGKQQQVDVRSLLRIASRPRSYKGHGTDIIAPDGPRGYCADDSLDLGILRHLKRSRRADYANLEALVVLLSGDLSRRLITSDPDQGNSQ